MSQIEGLPAGTGYEITETDYSSEGYHGTANSAKGPMTGTITGGTKAKEEVEVTNTFTPGGLTVTKTTAGNAADVNDTFGFKVTLEKAGTAGNHGTYTVARGTPQNVTFENNKAEITFRLKNGESAVFSGLPNGTSWKVEETDADKNGYVTSVSNTSTGTIAPDKTVSGTISAAASSADFTNTKNTTSIEAQKEWKKDASTALAWPSDVRSVTVGLKAKIGDGEATLISAITDTEIKSQFSFDLEKTISSAAVKAVWTSLPTRVRIPAEEADPDNNVEAVAEHWEGVTYSVEETKVTLTNGTELTGDALTAAYANTVAGDAETGYTITNIPQPETQFSFTKQWRDGSSTNDQPWPQRDKADASGEKEDIPITVHLMRKLNDASDGEIKDTTFNEDPANTYVISPSSLSGWTLNHGHDGQDNTTLESEMSREEGCQRYETDHESVVRSACPSLPRLSVHSYCGSPISRQSVSPGFRQLYPRLHADRGLLHGSGILESGEVCTLIGLPGGPVHRCCVASLLGNDELDGGEGPRGRDSGRDSRPVCCDLSACSAVEVKGRLPVGSVDRTGCGRAGRNGGRVV